MHRDLTDNEIDEFLRKQCYAHLACCEHVDYPYVIPVTFVYDKKAMYCFSFSGRKIDIMRHNMHIAIQTEELIDTNSWKSVIAWGEYLELKGEERDKALDIILERLWKKSVDGTPLFFPFRCTNEALEAAKKGQDVIVFKVEIGKWTGRLEHCEA